MAKREGASSNNAPHSKKPKQGNFFCDLCNVDCNSSDMLAKHCDGKKHRALMGRGYSKNSTTSKANKADKGKAAVQEEEEDQFHCEVCNVWCNSKVLMESHVNGKKHKAKEKKKVEGTVKEEDEAKKDKELWCRVCDLWCNSKIMMESHASGRKHKAKQEMAALYVDDDTNNDDDDEYCGVGVEGEVCDAKEEEIGGKGAADLGPQGQMGGDEAEIELKENVECLDTQDGVHKEEEGKETEDEEEEEAIIGCCDRVEESDAQGLISDGEDIMEEKENEEEGMENDEDVDVGCDGVEGSEAQVQLSDDEGETEAKEDVDCEQQEEVEEEEQEQEQEQEEEENRERKVLWCLMCRVQCNSQAMIMKHLKGSEHLETVALRRKRSYFGMK